MISPLPVSVVLNEQELNKTNPKVLMNDRLYGELSDWIDKYYRDRLSVEDLSDPQLLEENRSAVDDLTQMMGVGAIYPFQLA